MRAKVRDEVRAQWVAALRSGDYVQGTGYLTTIKHGVRRDCCLGVLCQLAADAGVGVAVTIGKDGIRSYDGLDQLPPPSVWAWATGSEASASKMGTDFDVEVANPHYLGEEDPSEPESWSSCLSEENDAGKDFEHIAGLIETQL